MFLDHRLSNIVETSSRDKTTPGIFRQIKISHRTVEIVAGVVDFCLMALVPAAVGIVYLDGYPENHLTAGACLAAGSVMAFLHVCVAWAHGLYRFPVLMAPLLKLGRVFKVWILTALLFIIVITLLAQTLKIPGLPIISALPAQILLLLFARWVFAKATQALVSTGSLQGRRIVTIGESAELVRLSPAFLLQCFGLMEVCWLAVATNPSRRTDELLAGIDRAVAAAGEYRAEEFLLALRWDSKHLLEAIRARLRSSSIPVRLLPDHNVRAMLAQHGFAPERGLFPLTLHKTGLSAFERLAKRAMDIIGSATAIVLLLPIFLAAAIAIRLDSGGPVIFRQKRTGLNGKEFVIFKFRTMTVLEDGPAIRQVSRGDHRVTRVGKFLRRSSIDELPQLFNVLKGDMSLVGPRPHAVAHDKHYKAVINDYSFRHYVKPGITGWAQVNGLRGETPSLQQMAERVELDRWYIDNWSIILDISILFRTCFEILGDRAY